MAARKAQVDGLATVRFVVRGVTPLLMNRMTAEQLEDLRMHRKAPKNAPRPEDPRVEAAPKVYQTEAGQPIVPAENVMACLVRAGHFVRLDGKRQLSSGRATLVPGLITLHEAFFPLMDPRDPDKPASWEVDMRQGRNPNGNEAVCIVRPRFDVWQFAVGMSWLETRLSERLVRELVDYGIGMVGLCDYRPEKRGIFGKGRVDRWER